MAPETGTREASALGLPPSLAALIADRYPNLRIPGDGDMTGGWAGYPKKRGLPFVARGDFNGDGRMDFALILLGARAWDLLAFHARPDGGYDALELNHFRGVLGPSPAQIFHVFTIKKGARLRIEGKLQPRHERDSLGLFYVGDPRSGLQLTWAAAPDAKREELRRLGFYSASGFNTD